MRKIALIKKGRYAIIKAKKKFDSWACIDDGNEITLIIKQEKIKNIPKYKIQKDFKIITFDMVLPFSMIGFISKIAGALAKQKIPIFVISAYSTDHLLIKEKYLSKTINVLKKLGFEIK